MAEDETIALERAFLSSLLGDPWKSLEVFSIIKPEDMILESHRDLFAGILALSSKGVTPDSEVLEHHLKKIGSRSASVFAKLIGTLQPVKSPPETARYLASESFYRTLISEIPSPESYRTQGKTPEEYCIALREYAKKGVERANNLKPDSDRPQPALLRDFLSEKPLGNSGWLVDGLIPRNGICIVVAEGGLGKTTLVTQMALNMSTGRDVFKWKTVAPVRTLVVEAEGSRDMYRERVKTATEVLRLDVDNATWAIQPAGSHKYEIGGHALEALISSQKAEFVILDTLFLFTKADENRAVDVKQLVMNPLKLLASTYNTTFMLIHHTTKNNENRQGWQKGRGSAALHDDCDIWLRLEDHLDHEPKDTKHLWLDKNRYGPHGYELPLRYVAENAVFDLVRNAIEIQNDAAASLREKIAIQITRLAPEGTERDGHKWVSQRAILGLNLGSERSVISTLESMVSDGHLAESKLSKGAVGYRMSD